MPGGAMRRVVAWLSCAGVGWACGSTADPAPGFGSGAGAPAQPAPSPSSAYERDPLPPLLDETPAAPIGDDRGTRPPGACATARSEAELVREPIDIVVLLDNSLSMVDEARSVEDTLNVNFASVLEDSGIDYRLILISRHRADDTLLGATAVCIDPPLGGGGPCPSARPSFGSRFFHYSTEVGSSDSFDVLLGSYDGRRRDDFQLAPSGWSAWLREGAKKVFLEISDDDENMPAATFLGELSALAPEQFGGDPGRPEIVWHSIVGLPEKANPVEAYAPSEPVQDGRCFGNLTTVFNSGRNYQELSRSTGGLRFPICQFGAYDQVFEAIAASVVRTSGVACGFSIPVPPGGQRLELDKVAVSYAPTIGAPIVFGQAVGAEWCQDNAFLVEGDGITLCPAACDRVRADPGASVEVLFTCESTLILR
jgi:hypothetical protein